MKYLSSYVKIYRNDDKTGMIYSALTGGVAFVAADFEERLKEGSLTPEETSALEEMDLLVENIDEERKKIAGLLDRWNETRRSLNAIVAVNLQCNLACQYCFEGDKKAADTEMSRETADHLVEFLVKRMPGNEKVRIDFYGGEPLLSVSLIQYISERMVEAVRERGLTYEFSLVTNGTLLSADIVEALLPLGLKQVKITLDGPSDLHDSQRPRKGGGGSFEAIVENVKHACKRVAIQIGGNFGRDNYHRFPELLDHLLAIGLRPSDIAAVKFDPIVQTESRLLPSFSGGCGSINEQWLWEASIYLREDILKRGFATVPITISPCMVSFDKEFVVNHDGSLYKCPGFICDERYCIGRLGDDKISESDVYMPDLWKNDRCLKCAYLPLCFGGCRYMEFVRRGEIVSVDCRLDFFNATLGPYIMQELRYAGGV